MPSVFLNGFGEWNETLEEKNDTHKDKTVSAPLSPSACYLFINNCKYLFVCAGLSAGEICIP